MGVDISGKGGDVHFNWQTWRALLTLAYDYGWKPAGTEPGRWVDPETGELDEQMSPNPDEWDGSYFTNGFQWVTDEDAAHIADALEQALDDILGGEGKQRVSDFIAYCRAGVFSIG
jgi:hypothetical protein